MQPPGQPLGVSCMRTCATSLSPCLAARWSAHSSLASRVHCASPREQTHGCSQIGMYRSEMSSQAGGEGLGASGGGTRGLGLSL